ncbi:MAG: GHKL domain-containing protein [Gammaproteobacteria bacterium]|jgi:two-component system OmpR family sensor kinase|nr:GHKL domain-containing protein [Gammaproteobacteria bacterium]MBU0787210.1 GHKL domain-containing protein [Gammaproteobacteria bacterium]MBU0814217.1 GHKL domain-containing protein [Gammaproteobacteria bacterium]MBU1786263.1 GHKL domain-containing protein [Gammaproteobacteria bacterium]
MDGFQERVKKSIQLQLSLWLSVAIMVVALVAGIFSFVGAFDEANELQDDILRQVAAMFRLQPGSVLNLGDTQPTDADAESNLIVQVLQPGPGNGGAGMGLPLTGTLQEGLQTVELKEASYRVMVKTLPDGVRIAVSQETRVRDEIARDSAVHTVLPLLILMPLLILVVADLVRRMFRPVVRLSVEIDERSEQALHALPDHGLPSEIRPFVIAINRLLARVAQSMEAQKRFIADASHELRSPMTALSLQAERLGGADMSNEARERFDALRQGIERGRSLLDQLLNLARAQFPAATASKPISMQQVFRHVLEDLMPLAEDKGVDVGVVDAANVLVNVDEVDLITVVKNLLDNAIRYTPSGGQIDLSVVDLGDQLVIEVQDSGPGISPHERERVLDPFYRVLGTSQAGSGLGLSIVKTIAERLHGRVELGDATHFAQGLRVTVRLDRKPRA